MTHLLKLSAGPFPAATCPNMCLQPGMSPNRLTTHTPHKLGQLQLHRPWESPPSSLCLIVGISSWLLSSGVELRRARPVLGCT